MNNIIGCDLHTLYQVVAWVDAGTGEIKVRRLEPSSEVVRTFYAPWPRGTVVGLEATFPALWFERLMAEPGTSCGYGTPREFGPVKCANRRPTRAMPNIS